MRRIGFVLVGLCALLSVPAQAARMFGFTPSGTQTLSVTTSTGVFNIDAHDTGWYRSDGFNQLPGNANYIVCFAGTGGSDCGDANPAANDFFAFRPGTISGTFLSATLSVGNPANGYDGPAGGLTMSLWDFTGSIDDLGAGTGGVGAYTDLGSGTLFASRTVSAADNGTQVVFNLNASALTAIAASLNQNNGPGLFVIGGSLSGGGGEVPEPASFLLTGAGIAGLLLLRRRSRS